ncbi:MAG: cyclic nucleotide-binding domain-containing protein [Pseudomonadota bacterium]
MVQVMAALAGDIAEKGIAMAPRDWAALRPLLRPVSYSKGECIYRMEEIGASWLFLADGVTASIQTHADGSLTIARFFEDRQVCGNLTSTWSEQYASDDLVAITQVSGVEIAGDVFRQQMLEGGDFGRYLRLKAMETLCFDKELIVAKTQLDLEKRYRFLEEHYQRVVGSAMQKQLAAFTGVTPEALSRFLRRRSGR